MFSGEKVNNNNHNKNIKQNKTKKSSRHNKVRPLQRCKAFLMIAFDFKRQIIELMERFYFSVRIDYMNSAN